MAHVLTGLDHALLFAFALLNGSVHAEEAFDLSGAKGQSIFFALGMLDAYTGRQYVEDTDVVERVDRDVDAGAISIMRIGFDRSGRTAVAFVAYQCVDDRRFISVAAFARKTGRSWTITHYAVQN